MNLTKTEYVKHMVFVLFIGIFLGLIISLWWRAAQIVHMERDHGLRPEWVEITK